MGSLVEVSPAPVPPAQAPSFQNKQLGHYFDSTTPVHKSPSLPNDILYEILSYYLREQDAAIRHPSPQRNPDTHTQLWSTLRFVLFLSRRYYLLVRPFLYHSICLSNSVDVEKLYNTLRANPSIGQHVKALQFIEPRNFDDFPKTKEPAPDLLGILVYILHHLHHLKYFRFLSADIQGSTFQDTFISFFNRRAAQETETETATETDPEVRSLPLLSSVEEVDLSRIRYPKQGSFLRVLLYRPNIQSLSISETTPVLKMYFGPQLGINTSPIRKLTLCNPTTLTDASMLVRLPKSLEVLSLHICPEHFYFPDDQDSIDSALQTQATNLKELHLTAHSSRAPDPSSNWGPQFRPYILSKYRNLRTLSIPNFLYTHTYRKLGTSNVLPTLLSPEIRTLAISTWFFSKITPDMIATIAVASGEVAPNLDRIVIKDMRGGNAERMAKKFAAAEDVCFMRGIALECEDVSAFTKGGVDKRCGVCS
ncbi:hypothetical protein BJX62DRAFT_238300 [Aspergillus germanicus]